MNATVDRVTKLHREAIAYVDESTVAQLLGDNDEYLRYTKLAFEKERAAADLMADRHVEPTRSVLHRSAASLAWRCEKYDEAKQLIDRALDGSPPRYVVSELNELLEMVEAALEAAASAPLRQPEPVLAS